MHVTPFKCCLHKTLHTFDIGFEEQHLVFQRKLRSHLHSSQCRAAESLGSAQCPASQLGRTFLLSCQGHPSQAQQTALSSTGGLSFDILVIESILSLLGGRHFLLVRLK